MNKLVEFFERPEIGKAVKRAFLGSLVLLIVLELFVHKHPYFPWAGTFTFYAVYGFLACALIIAVSKILGIFWLQKGEDYYD